MLNMFDSDSVVPLWHTVTLLLSLNVAFYCELHVFLDVNNHPHRGNEEVVLHLLLTKCVPVLLYGIETCSMRKTDLDSLDFVVNRFFMKLFARD